jgi:hypothetical protein
LRRWRLEGWRQSPLKLITRIFATLISSRMLMITFFISLVHQVERERGNLGHGLTAKKPLQRTCQKKKKSLEAEQEQKRT